MSQVSPELAHTVALLLRYRMAIQPMLLTSDKTKQVLALAYAGGIDLLHIIVQLMVVPENVAREIFKECKGFDPKFYQFDFRTTFHESTVLRGEVERFIRPKVAFVAIVDRMKSAYQAHKRPRMPWWLENISNTIASIWDHADKVPANEDLDKRRFALLYKISLRASEMVADPPKDVVDAYSKLKDCVDQHTQRSLGHSTIATLGYRQQAMYFA